jgi:hypothetical protein
MCIAVISVVGRAIVVNSWAVAPGVYGSGTDRARRCRRHADHATAHFGLVSRPQPSRESSFWTSGMVSGVGLARPLSAPAAPSATGAPRLLPARRRSGSRVSTTPRSPAARTPPARSRVEAPLRKLPSETTASTRTLMHELVLSVVPRDCVERIPVFRRKAEYIVVVQVSLLFPCDDFV